MGLFDDKEKRFREAAPAKDKIVCDVASAVKQVQSAFVQRDEEGPTSAGKIDWSLERFCRSIDRVLSYALRDTSSSASCWNYLITITHGDTVDRIKRKVELKTGSGRARSWVRIAVNEGALESYFNIISADASKIKMETYRTHSLAFDSDRLNTLSVHVAAVESLGLKLPPSSSALDELDYGADKLVVQAGPRPTIHTSMSPAADGPTIVVPAPITSSSASSSVAAASLKKQTRGKEPELAAVVLPSVFASASQPSSLTLPGEHSTSSSLAHSQVRTADLEEPAEDGSINAAAPLVFEHQARVKKVRAADGTTKKKKKKKVPKIVSLDGESSSSAMSSRSQSVAALDSFPALPASVINTIDDDASVADVSAPTTPSTTRPSSTTTTTTTTTSPSVTAATMSLPASKPMSIAAGRAARPVHDDDERDTMASGDSSRNLSMTSTSNSFGSASLSTSVGRYGNVYGDEVLDDGPPTVTAATLVEATKKKKSGSKKQAVGSVPLGPDWNPDLDYIQIQPEGKQFESGVYWGSPKEKSEAKAKGTSTRSESQQAEMDRLEAEEKHRVKAQLEREKRAQEALARKEAAEAEAERERQKIAKKEEEEEQARRRRGAEEEKLAAARRKEEEKQRRVAEEEAKAATAVAAAAAAASAAAAAEEEARVAREADEREGGELGRMQRALMKSSSRSLGSSVVLDNQTQLKLLLEVFRHDNEKLLMVERVRLLEQPPAPQSGPSSLLQLGRGGGGPAMPATERMVFLLLTNFAVYVMSQMPVDTEEKCHADASDDLRSLKDIQVRLRSQGFTLRFPRVELVFVTREEQLTESILQLMLQACQRVGMVVVPLRRDDVAGKAAVDAMLCHTEPPDGAKMRHYVLGRARRVLGDAYSQLQRACELCGDGEGASAGANDGGDGDDSDGEQLWSTVDENLQRIVKRLTLNGEPYLSWYSSRRLLRSGQLRYKATSWGRERWQALGPFSIQGGELHHYKAGGDAVPVDLLTLRSGDFRLTRLEETIAQQPNAFEVSCGGKTMVLAAETEGEAREWCRALMGSHCEPLLRPGRRFFREDLISAVGSVSPARVVMFSDILVVCREGEQLEIAHVLPLVSLEVIVDDAKSVRLVAPHESFVCSGDIPADWAKDLSEYCERRSRAHAAHVSRAAAANTFALGGLSLRSWMGAYEPLPTKLGSEYTSVTVVVTSTLVHVCGGGTGGAGLVQLAQVAVDSITRVVCDDSQLSNTATLVVDDMDDSESHSPLQVEFASEEERILFLLVLGEVWRDIFMVELTVAHVR